MTAKLTQIIQETNKSSTYAPGPCHVHVIVSYNKHKTLQQMKILNTEFLIQQKLALVDLISKTPQTILSHNVNIFFACFFFFFSPQCHEQCLGFDGPDSQ